MAPMTPRILLLPLMLSALACAENGETLSVETPHAHTNRLANESSPYLLQHAHNPVDWFPWSEEAFAKAKEEDKPIFLSIGYSTCHWCHVMERESFENVEIAAILNEHFVAIKVDREERPDVDNVYMWAVQALSGRGGWPLSVFLTPEGKPFWGGTYFPPEDRFGRPGFKSVLLRMSAAWRDTREEVVAGADKLTEFVADMSVTVEGDAATEPLARRYSTRPPSRSAITAATVTRSTPRTMSALRTSAMLTRVEGTNPVPADLPDPSTLA